MKKLMIDMDEVITTNNFERAINEYLGYEFDFKNFKGFRLQEALGDKRSEFFIWLRNQDYYKDATLIDNCYEVMQKLNKKYELYVVTDYIWPEKEMLEYNGKFIDSKYRFLQKKLDFLNPNQFIFSPNKKIINCDIKIDDKIDNLENSNIKLMFTAWHNKDLTDKELKSKGITRVNGWKDIEKIL